MDSKVRHWTGTHQNLQALEPWAEDMQDYSQRMVAQTTLLRKDLPAPSVVSQAVPPMVGLCAGGKQLM